ncbi:MAG: hypothetical protein IKQ44_02420 [Lachnospiraceae bacterium]|nr:hypothetical protein [Lachnospiraceae bacterium]
MKDMIKFLKLCKYSFKFKTNCIFLIIFFIIGVINEVVTKGTQYLGGFYIVLTSIYLFQFVMSLSMSDMIQSSGIGRRIQLDMPVKLNGFLSIVLYTLLIVFRLSMARIHPEYIVDNTSSLLMIDIMFFLLFIYTGFVYKYFIVSILVFCFTFAFITTGMNIMNSLDIFSKVSLNDVVIFGYIVIIIGVILQYLICKILIRKPISQRAFRGVFKDAK